MRRSLRLVLLMAVASAMAGAVLPAAAQAAFKPCKKGKTPLCGTVVVPLDRSGVVKGTVKLRVVKVPARRSPAAGTVLQLAGGPGQGAIKSLNANLVKALPNFDYVVFDQRGTGLSGRLRCKATRKSQSTEAAARCARELGPRRGYYRSYDSSEDIEAVRVALGSPKLSLYSVSYGGRVAGEYVRRHPASVARQVLDSPTPITGTDPFSRQVAASRPRVLDALAPGTSALLAKAVARLPKRGARATVYSPRGRAIRGRITAEAVYSALTSLDLDPYGRGQLPGALAALARGDTAPFARIAAGGGKGGGLSKSISVPLFLATSCSEAPLPWNTATPPTKARVNSVTAALKTFGAAPFAPFSGLTAVKASGLIPQCLLWPAVPKAPAVPVPPAASPAPQPALPPAQTQPTPGQPTAEPSLPPATTQPPRAQASQAAGKSPVPSLIIEGTEDTRTPLETGQTTAATYSSGTVLDVPFTGHSTVGTDVSKCALRNTALFFTSGAALGCQGKRLPLAPVIKAFPRSIASVKGRGRARSRLAARLTFRDALLHVAPSPHVGGLRGGFASRRKNVVRLSRYSLLRGVRVSGRVRVKGGKLSGTLRVSGGGATPARVKLR